MRAGREKMGAALLRLWRSKRSFRGFAPLLFYCHMLMLFSVLTRAYLAGAPEYVLLISAGKLLVPLLFTLTSLSLFISPLFWPALSLAFLHLPLALVAIARGPAGGPAWFLGLAGLAILLLYTLYLRLRN